MDIQFKNQEEKKMSEQREQSMVALANSIEAFLNRFGQLMDKFGHKESYKALQRQYCDMCCAGDVMIQEIIKGLNTEDPQYYVKFMEEETTKNNAEEFKRLIDDYLMETLNELEEANLDLPVFY